MPKLLQDWEDYLVIRYRDMQTEILLEKYIKEEEGKCVLHELRKGREK